MKKILKSISAAVLISFPAAASVTILENTPSQLRFAWNLGSLDTVSLLDSAQFVTTVLFDGANSVLGDFGEPVIPGYSVYAGIPLAGRAVVSFTPGPVRNVDLAHPLKRHPPRDGRIGKEAVRTTIRQGESWVTAPRYTWMRNLRVTHVVICPVRYNAALNRLTVLESGECTIRFPSAVRTLQPVKPQSDFQRMLKSLVMNYEVALPWSKPLLRPLRKAPDPFPFDYSQQVYTFKIGDGHDDYNEMTIRENGILKISGAQVKRLFKDSTLIGMQRVALYGSWKGALPMAASPMGGIPAGVREIPLIRVDADSNLVVDDGDYFLAYVTGLSDWQYDTVNSEFAFKVDPYDDNRTYWLAIKSAGSGAAMASFRQPPGSADTVDHFINRVAFKKSEHKFVEISNGIPYEQDAIGFVWVCLKPGNRQFTLPLDLPNCDTTDSGSVRFKAFSWKDGSVIVSATIGGDSVCSDCQMDRDYTVRKWGDRTLRLVLTSLQSTYYLQLDHMQVKYRYPLRAGSDTVRMHVFSKIDSMPVTYRLSQINGKRVTMFRIPTNEDSVSLIDTLSAVDAFAWSDYGNTGIRYFIVNEKGYLELPDNAFTRPDYAASSPYVAVNLRDIGNEADYVIIAPPAFFTQAKRLAEHKSKHGFSHPRVVSINDIYADFSGGNIDPTAIRNFLAFAQRNWKNGDRLDYALLLGSGHYDYKQVKTGEPNHIIPAEVAGYNFPFSLGSSCADDYYAFLETTDTSAMSIAIGRLPGMTEGEASVMVDKIIETEDRQKADFGSWRNSVLLVADDDMQGPREDLIRGKYGHHGSSERVAAVIDGLWPSLEMRKTYLFDYEWDANWEKPEASRAIINEINNGVGYVNFFGHGSEVYWADEHVLSPDIVPQLYNDKRYPIVASYSCSVGKFDKPENVSLGELLLKLPGAGAIASFAGSRSASAAGNEVLAMDLYAAIFDTVSFPSLGMAIIRGKSLHNDLNSLIYILFGDPSLRLVHPQRRVQLEICDTTGTVDDTLAALQKIRIRGRIVDGNGNTDQGFGTETEAFVQIGLYNAPQMTTRKDNGDDQTVRYLQPGKPVFSGRTTVRNGAFEQTAILPQNLSFNMAGVKLTGYAWENSKAAVGARTTLVFSGSLLPDEKSDSTGPRITIRPVYEVDNMLSASASFTDRVVSSLPLKCEIALHDASGINVMGTGPDEGLTVEIPGIMSRRNINHKFQFSEGDFRSGIAVIAFEEKSMAVGTYELAVTSQDLLGNLSKVTFALEITDENEPTLDHVFNTPNPVRMGRTTRFFFYPSTAQPYLNARFLIKIYSLSGRLLRVFKDATNGTVWDLKDQTGYPLPPNIYLYQVTGYYVTEKQVKSEVRKLVIHPPR
ncbi:MAG: hypothetical protein JW768_16370 [Chitinispirillaceae bacterium]|nr:hypothetical protein [Chitinispirillaceae bacterium]